MPSTRWIAWLWCGVFSAGMLAVAGCSHYQLGTGGTRTFRTLYIAPVSNATMLPQSVALVTTQLRQHFARDARVALVNSAAEADATLHVTLTHYGREIAAARSDDTGLARKFNLTLQAACTLRERGGKTHFENRSIAAQREAFTDDARSRSASGFSGGQLQSEYQALPLLAESLASKVVHAALDVW